MYAQSEYNMELHQRTGQANKGQDYQSSRHQVMFLRLLSGKVKEGHKTLYAMKKAWHAYMTLDLKKLSDDKS